MCIFTSVSLILYISPPLSLPLSPLLSLPLSSLSPSPLSLSLSPSLSLRPLQPAVKMVAAAKAAVPTVGDQASALQLGNFAKATAAALAELRASSAKVRKRRECVSDGRCVYLLCSV